LSATVLRCTSGRFPDVWPRICFIVFIWIRRLTARSPLFIPASTLPKSRRNSVFLPAELARQIDVPVDRVTGKLWAGAKPVRPRPPRPGEQPGHLPSSSALRLRVGVHPWAPAPPQTAAGSTESAGQNWLRSAKVAAYLNLRLPFVIFSTFDHTPNRSIPPRRCAACAYACPRVTPRKRAIVQSPDLTNRNHS
jgi:hypothetical protein